MTTPIYEEERLLLHIQECIAEAMADRDITAPQLAHLVGVYATMIHHALCSGRGLTIRTIAQLLYACGYRLAVTLEKLP